jgi:hypothetical protein
MRKSQEVMFKNIFKVSIKGGISNGVFEGEISRVSLQGKSQG